jgi:hypothetical protein
VPGQPAAVKALVPRRIGASDIGAIVTKETAVNAEAQRALRKRETGQQDINANQEIGVPGGEDETGMTRIVKFASLRETPQL